MGNSTNCAEKVFRNTINKIIPKMKELNLQAKRIYCAPQKIKKHNWYWDLLLVSFWTSRHDSPGVYTKKKKASCLYEWKISLAPDFTTLFNTRRQWNRSGKYCEKVYVSLKYIIPSKLLFQIKTLQADLGEYSSHKTFSKIQPTKIKIKLKNLGIDKSR